MGQILTAIQAVEDRFNKNGYHYPYVFLNDEPFSQNFIDATSALISSNASYGKLFLLPTCYTTSYGDLGLVPTDHWVEPSWIDEEKAAASRAVLEEKQVLYAGSVSYRRMCRYQSGFFFRHDLLKDYDWCKLAFSFPLW